MITVRAGSADIEVDANEFQVDKKNNLCLGTGTPHGYVPVAMFKYDVWIYCVLDGKKHKNQKIEVQETVPFFIELRKTVPRNVYGLQFDKDDISFWVADFYSDTQAYRMAANLNDAWLKRE